MASISTLPRGFGTKKKRILESLAVPSEAYDDLSPKGSVDEGIRDLIDEINHVSSFQCQICRVQISRDSNKSWLIRKPIQLEGCVTTSSCAGRISVFLEGKKWASDPEFLSDGQEVDVISTQENVAKATVAGVGGKGGGGRWLFVSHDRLRVDYDEDLAGLLGMKMSREEHARDPRRRLIRFKFEPMVSDL